MPYWQPNWEDVRWNSSVAEAFIGTLLATATALETIVQEHRTAGATYFLAWQGEKSTTIPAALEIGYQPLLSRATAYRDLAQHVRNQMTRAVDAQRQRSQDRQRWHAEVAAEQQRTNPAH